MAVSCVEFEIRADTWKQDIQIAAVPFCGKDGAGHSCLNVRSDSGRDKCFVFVFDWFHYKNVHDYTAQSGLRGSRADVCRLWGRLKLKEAGFAEINKAELVRTFFRRPVCRSVVFSVSPTCLQWYRLFIGSYSCPAQAWAGGAVEGRCRLKAKWIS